MIITKVAFEKCICLLVACIVKMKNQDLAKPPHMGVNLTKIRHPVKTWLKISEILH